MKVIPFKDFVQMSPEAVTKYQSSLIQRIFELIEIRKQSTDFTTSYNVKVTANVDQANLYTEALMAMVANTAGAIWMKGFMEKLEKLVELNATGNPAEEEYLKDWIAEYKVYFDIAMQNCAEMELQMAACQLIVKG